MRIVYIAPSALACSAIGLWMYAISRSFASVPKTTKLVTLLIVLILQSAYLRLECQATTSNVISKDTSAQTLQIDDARLRIDIDGPMPDLPRAALKQHVVRTGAGRGIGQAIALAERGARVVATDLEPRRETAGKIGPEAFALNLM